MASREDNEGYELHPQSGAILATTGVAPLSGILEGSVIETPTAPSPGKSAEKEKEKARKQKSIQDMRTRLIERADRMAQELEWTRAEFLAGAGCSGDATVPDEQLEDFLLSCVSYFDWLQRMSDQLDLAADRQLVVLGSTELYNDSDRRLYACKDAMEAPYELMPPAEDVAAAAREVAPGAQGSPPPIPPTAMQLLELGEVIEAFQVARGHLSTPAGLRTKAVLLDDPLYAFSPHIDEQRIALASSDPELLGGRVAGRILEHVAGCPICGEPESVRDPEQD
jgi:hypothetical protein